MSADIGDCNMVTMTYGLMGMHFHALLPQHGNRELIVSSIHSLLWLSHAWNTGFKNDFQLWHRCFYTCYDQWYINGREMSHQEPQFYVDLPGKNLWAQPWLWHPCGYGDAFLNLLGQSFDILKESLHYVVHLDTDTTPPEFIMIQDGDCFNCEYMQIGLSCRVQDIEGVEGIPHLFVCIVMRMRPCLSDFAVMTALD